MSKVIYKSSSPYYTTTQMNWFLSNLDYREIPLDSSDFFRVIDSNYEYRPDKLSYDLYGTASYWWVFMIVNQNLIVDPIYDFKTGLEIRIVTPSRLSNLLGE